MKDLEAAVRAGCDGIFLPKVASAESVVRCSAMLGLLEMQSERPAGSVELILAIENAAAVLHMEEICRASYRVSRIAIGPEDFNAELGVPVTAAGHERTVANGLVVLAAVATGVAPMGLLGDALNFRDLETLRTDAVRSAAFRIPRRLLHSP